MRNIKIMFVLIERVFGRLVFNYFEKETKPPVPWSLL